MTVRRHFLIPRPDDASGDEPPVYTLVAVTVPEEWTQADVKQRITVALAQWSRQCAAGREHVARCCPLDFDVLRDESHSIADFLRAYGLQDLEVESPAVVCPDWSTQEELDMTDTQLALQLVEWNGA